MYKLFVVFGIIIMSFAGVYAQPPEVDPGSWQEDAYSGFTSDSYSN